MKRYYICEMTGNKRTVLAAFYSRQIADNVAAALKSKGIVVDIDIREEA